MKTIKAPQGFKFGNTEHLEDLIVAQIVPRYSIEQVG